MPQKKDLEGASKRLGRNRRRNRSKEKNPLEEVSIPVDKRPREPLPLIRENIVTVAAASTSNRDRHNNSSEHSSEVLINQLPSLTKSQPIRC